MATNNYSISFKSLRTNAVYTLNIGGGSGTAIALKGGAQPFTTEENDDEDQFCPIRTQTGHIRIVDDGKDANGNALAADWWKDLAPINDTERPVTLTGVDANGNSLGTLWQGFMQAQNFGGTLYGNPQEREFPVQCIISVLAAKKVSTTQTQLCNFAYLLRYIFNTLPSDLRPTSYVIQGGAHAQQWLLKQLDWNNFLQEDKDNDVTARYNLYQILEDICRFWGWTCRTHKTTVYMTCADDTAESNLLVLTPANLDTMADSNTAAGDATDVFSTTTISGDVFASTGNDDFKQRGAGKATVKADVNANDRVVKVFPVSVEKSIETNGWTWVQEQGEDLVGYFETNSRLYSFDTAILSGTCNANQCYFSRRQIYTSKDSDAAVDADMMVFKYIANYSEPYFSLQTKKAMAFAGGCLKISGTIYTGAKVTNWVEHTRLRMRIGIGMSRASARWFYLDPSLGGVLIDSGWSQQGTERWCHGGVVGGNINGVALVAPIVAYHVFYFPSIPVTDSDMNNLYGYLFVDIGDFVSNGVASEGFEIADLTITYTRDGYVLPRLIGQTRGREIKEERVTSQDYTATNNNQTHEEWNADCIFASDNNMKYGYGLLMNSDGTFMESAPYAAGNEHPEQHLANRVTNYWAVSRRRLGGDFRVGTIADITPQYKVTIDGTTCHPVAISRDWRNDVVRLSLLEMPTQ